MEKVRHILWEFYKKRAAFSFTSFSKLISQLVIAGIGIKRFSSLVSCIFFLLIGQGLLAQTQLGSDFVVTQDERHGYRVSLSADGSRLAISSPYHEGGPLNSSGNNLQNGRVRVFEYNSNSGSWTQLGSDIYGKNAEKWGTSMTLSADGSRVAMSNSYYTYGQGSPIYSAAVYEYESSSNTWSQVGDYIDGIAGENFGSSLSLSSDGSKLVVGANNYDLSSSSSAYADYGRVGVYYDDNGTWKIERSINHSQHIPGQGQYENFGYNVSISSIGLRLAITGRANGSGSPSIARFYDLNTTDYSEFRWQEQAGSEIEITDPSSRFPLDMSLSSDGSRVVISDGGNDENGSNSGKVQVYEYNKIGRAHV